MKRHNHIYEQLCNMDNIRKAELSARKNKKNQYGVRVFDRNKESNLLNLYQMLVTKSYRTSPYRIFKVYDPKEREVYALPYFPDRILHHLVMIPLEPIFNKLFTTDTYSCIKGKGIHAATYSLRKALKNEAATKYPKAGKENCLHLQVAIGEIKYVCFTPTLTLISQITQIDKKDFPITTKIIKSGKRLEFS